MTRREAEPLLGYAPGSLKTVMREQRGRWPAPVACRVRGHVLLYDLDALQAAVQPATTKRSRRPGCADADGLVTCLTCGRRFRSLGPHLARAHQMTAAEYRAEHHLPASAALMATEARSTLSAARTAAMADDPELIERMRAAALPREELFRRSAEARAGTDGLPAVQAARRTAARRTLPAAHRARQGQMEEKARAAGFASMTDAIRATLDLSSRAAAARIGIDPATVRRWRGLDG